MLTNKIQISNPVKVTDKSSRHYGQEGVVMGQVRLDNPVTMPFYHIAFKDGTYTLHGEKLEVLEEDF